MLIPLLFAMSIYSMSYASELQIKIEGFKSERGHLLYILFDKEEGFPDEPSSSARQGMVTVQEAKQGIILHDLAPGTYAHSVNHDENDNDKLDTNILGIPKEGVGFSNNPKLMFGAPGFEKCSFDFVNNQKIKIELKHF